MDRTYPVERFGAVADGATLNTAAIQAAIDACHRAGGGMVVCGPGRFVTGSLDLRSGVELHLERGCVLAGSTRLEDYRDFVAPGFDGSQAAEGSIKYLISAVAARQVAITGAGEIDGSGPSFFDTTDASLWGRFYRKPGHPRPRMVMMLGCTDVRLEDAAFVDSPCWTLWLMKCRRVGVHRVRVVADQRMINSDGLDLDSCQDVTVSDCLFRTGDDCIVLFANRQVLAEAEPCENVVVSNCVLDSWCQGVRVGVPGHGTIRYCTFRNLVIRSARNGIFFEYPRRYLPAGDPGSADVHDISFSGVLLECGDTPVLVSVDPGIALTRLERLSFSNFRIRSGGPCVVQGSPETTIRDVRFSDVVVETTGPEAIRCSRCESVKLVNVELSSVPRAGPAVEVAARGTAGAPCSSPRE